MKGVVLCGGLGTRLKPLTDVLNKHLLPVHDRPMCFYPLEMLAEAGITEVLMVVGGQSTGDFLKLLKDGSRFGLKLYFVYQEGEKGIAHALSLAEPFVGNDTCCVVLGDNVLGESLRPHKNVFLAQSFRHNGLMKKGARVLLKKVSDPENYGVPVFNGARIEKIEEKPKWIVQMSNFAVIGVYFYDQSVFDRVKYLKASERGELEITDLNNSYADDELLTYSKVEGYWGDAGASIEALEEVSKQVSVNQL